MHYNACIKLWKFSCLNGSKSKEGTASEKNSFKFTSHCWCMQKSSSIRSQSTCIKKCTGKTSFKSMSIKYLSTPIKYLRVEANGMFRLILFSTICIVDVMLCFWFSCFAFVFFTNIKFWGGDDRKNGSDIKMPKVKIFMALFSHFLGKPVSSMLIASTPGYWEWASIHRLAFKKIEMQGI